MFGRFYAIAVAILFVLPAVLVVDAIVRPEAAWSRVGRSKWRWVAAFAFAPVACALTRSFLPAIAVVPVSFFYMAKVRSLLEVSTGLEHAESGRGGLTAQQQEALAPLLLTCPPVLLFLGIILWTGNSRERLVASAMALAALAVAGAATWTNFRRR